MRESMSRLTLRFSANRAVREYTEKYYLPAAAAYRERASDHGANGRSLLQWKHALAEHWASVRFGELRVASSAQTRSLQVAVYLGELRTDWVRIQLYAAPHNREPPFVSEMTQTGDPEPSAGWRIYRVQASASRRASDYTPRLVPALSGARIPLEDPHILWFR
jgi:starch phosphorylase